VNLQHWQQKLCALPALHRRVVPLGAEPLDGRDGSVLREDGNLVVAPVNVDF
jgi:hypothetical protein